jgi:5-(carboxyamino)imidazole ribonucleotide synthase
MKPIGILGGGQLARMLILEAHRLNIPVACLSPSETDPAREVTANWFQGDPNKVKDLTNFMRRCSSVTYESEFYDATAILEASKETKVLVWPEPKLMGILQDRLSQKNLFDEYDLPTAPWRPVDSAQDAVVAYVALDGRLVFKKRRGGYDGYGTFIVKSDGDLGAFANDGVKEPFIAERIVRFSRELAVIAIRDQSGHVFFYPFVESKQQNSRCLWVKGPLKETVKLKDLKKRLTKFLHGIQYVGAMGIELFETTDGLLINEIAPRVHNTGHYTMDAFNLSQFTLHMQAVCGMEVSGNGIPLAKSKAFAMWNLLGTKKSSSLTPWKHTSFENGTHVHWYGKLESREGRKMGHVNTNAPRPDVGIKLAKRAADKLKKEIGF